MAATPWACYTEYYLWHSDRLKLFKWLIARKSQWKRLLGLEIFPWKFWFPRAKQAGTPAYLAASSAVTPSQNSASFPSVLDSLSCTGLYGCGTADLHFHLTLSNIKKIAAVILQAVGFWISKWGSHKVKDHLSETHEISHGGSLSKIFVWHDNCSLHSF